jgi:hypothetical protein
MNLKLSPRELKLAREWIKECSWREEYTEDEIDELSDQAVEKGVDRHFSGGVAEFKETCVD